MPGPEGIEGPCNGFTALSIHRGAPASMRAAEPSPYLLFSCGARVRGGTVFAEIEAICTDYRTAYLCLWCSTHLALNSAHQLAESQIHIPRTPVSLAEWILHYSFGLNSMSPMIYVIWD